MEIQCPANQSATQPQFIILKRIIDRTKPHNCNTEGYNYTYTEKFRVYFLVDLHTIIDFRRVNFDS